MLTVMPPRTDEERALLDVVKTLRRFDWDIFLTAWAAAFHIVVAFTLFLAPWDQIFSAGTKPVLDLASRYVWAAVFVVAAVGIMIHRPRAFWVKAAAWIAVLLLHGIWLTALSLAVVRGQGNAIGVVVWFFLNGPTAVVAYRSLGKR